MDSVLARRQALSVPTWEYPTWIVFLSFFLYCSHFTSLSTLSMVMLWLRRMTCLGTPETSFKISMAYRIASFPPVGQVMVSLSFPCRTRSMPPLGPENPSTPIISGEYPSFFTAS